MCNVILFPAAVDLTYGVVCCFQCGDYVYDRELEIIAQKHQTKASLSLGLGQVYHSWEPTEEEIELLKKHPRRKKITDSSIIGIEIPSIFILDDNDVNDLMFCQVSEG